MAKKVKASRAVPALQVPPDQWAARNIELVPFANLKPHPDNVTVHDTGQVDDIAESYAEHGMVRPWVINERDEILAGHGGRLTVQRFGAQVEAVPCVRVSGWSRDQERKFMLRDNVLGDRRSWDKNALGLQLADLSKLQGVDLTRLGFKQAQLAKLLPQERANGQTDPDADAPAIAPAVSRSGDLWHLGEHRLLCGDCTVPADVVALMAGERAGICNTDPPYGIDFSKLKNGIPRSGFAQHQERWGDIKNDTLTDGAALQAFLESAIKVAADHALLPNSAWYLWHPMLTQGTFFAAAAAAAAADILIHRQIVWVKPGFVLTRSGQYHWRHELCFYGWRSGQPCPWYGDKSQTTVWQIGRDADAGQHPTQKPVELFARPIENHTRKGELVYEPFSGSGSQIIAGEMTGRRVRAIEIHPAYVDVGVKRWESFTGKGAILANGGERESSGFAAVAKSRGIAVAA